MADDELPDNIKKYEKLRNAAKSMTEHTEEQHMQAYLFASKELKQKAAADSKDGKTPKDFRLPELLKKPEYRDFFADKMAAYHEKEITTYLEKKFDKPGLKLDTHDIDRMMSAYIGVTRKSIFTTVNQLKQKYTFGQHKHLSDQIVHKIGEQLEEVAGQHFKDDNIDDLLKRSKVNDLVERAKVDLPHAIGAYAAFKDSGGTMSKEILEEAGLADILKKEKKKK